MHIAWISLLCLSISCSEYCSQHVSAQVSKAYVIWLLTFWGKHIPLRLIKAKRAYPIKLTHVYIPTFIYNVKDFTEY